MTVHLLYIMTHVRSKFPPTWNGCDVCISCFAVACGSSTLDRLRARHMLLVYYAMGLFFHWFTSHGQVLPEAYKRCLVYVNDLN